MTVADPAMSRNPFDGVVRGRGSLRRLWPFLWRYPLRTIFSVLCAVLAAGFAILVPVVTSRVIIDDILLAAHPANVPDYGQGFLVRRLEMATGLPPLGSAALLDVMWIALSVLFAYLFATQSARVELLACRDLRIALIAHLERLPAAFYDRVTTGQMLTRVTNDVESLTRLLTGSGVVAADVIPFLIALSVMLTSDGGLTLKLLPLMPIVGYLGYLFRRRSLGIVRHVRDRLSRLNETLHEMLAGIEVVKLAGLEARNLDRLTTVLDEARDWESRLVRIETLFFPVVESLSFVAMGCILWYGGGHVFGGRISIGTIVLFLQFSDMLFHPVISLGNQADELIRALPAAERIFALLDWQESLRLPRVPVPLPDDLRGKIEFRDLSFRYETGGPVLTGIYLTIAPGEVIAIVGPTGSGKTTLARLLCRFYDVADGTLFIDDIDIMCVAPEQLRRRIGLILQDFHIFPGTVLDNITLGDQAVTLDRAVEAARLVQALPFIEALPQGFQTILEARGTNLSQGQRQLLAFARVVALDAEILILDEATASIDPETERQIQAALSEVKRGRTTLIIAHRLHTIRDATRVVVLDQGRIAECGTHDHLMEQGGLYRRLYDLQARRYET